MKTQHIHNESTASLTHAYFTVARVVACRGRARAHDACAAGVPLCADCVRATPAMHRRFCINRMVLLGGFNEFQALDSIHPAHLGRVWLTTKPHVLESYWLCAMCKETVAVDSHGRMLPLVQSVTQSLTLY